MTALPARRRPPRAVVLAPIGLLIVALVSAVFVLRPKPDPATVPAPPTVPLIVSVSHAGDPAIHEGYPATITVHALGDAPIVAVELWVGDRLLAEATSSGGAPAQVARWSWTPASAGPAVLVARATDDRGREAQSAPLRLTVAADPPRYRPVRPVTVAAGQSALEAAVAAGGETGDLPRWNDGLDPMEPLEAGSVVYVPFAVRDVPPPTVEAEIEALAGVPLGPSRAALGAGTASLASWTGAGDEIDIGPAAATGLFVPPGVKPAVTDCTIQLAVSSAAANAAGLAVYGLAPKGAAFSELATFPAADDGSTYATPAVAGTYLFSVSTYDDAVEEHGDLVAVDVPAECGDPAWQGAATLSNGRLRVAREVDRAYLYLSQDEGPWRRVPSEPDAFVERLDGSLDFGPYLPPDLASTAVDIEAWGWSGAGLLDLGKGHADPAPPPGAAPAPPAGGSGGAALLTGDGFTSLDWIAAHAPAGTPEIGTKELLLRDGELDVWTSQGVVKTELSRDFRWLTNASGVDGLLWQVAAFPIPSGVAPDAPGVLLQKVVPLAEGTLGGDFPIDLRPIFAPPTQTADVGDVLSGGLVQQLTLAQLGSVSTSPPTAPGPPAAADPAAAYSPSWLLSKFSPNVLYIRVIPMDGTAVAGAVSNFVKFSVVTADAFGATPGASFAPGPTPAPGPTGPRPYDLFLQFLPPANANPEFADCVVVVGLKPGWPASKDLQVGDFFCAVYSNTDSGWTLAGAFEDFVDLVADAWDAVTSAWSYLQAQLASAIAKYSGCSAIAGGGFCEGLAKVGISVALTAVGIPPYLPNTKDLVAMGKGELKETLVKLASGAAKGALGFDPCDAAYLAKQGLGTAACDDIADQLLDDLVALLDDIKTTEASAITGVMVPPGALVVPHPWGQLRAPRFRVTIARNTAVPLPASGTCQMTLSMTSVVTNWSHKSYDAQTGTWGKKTETVSGAPFAGLSVAVPDPSKAEGAVTLPTLLPKDASIYKKLLAALNEKVVINRDYYLTETNFWREFDNPGQIYKPGQGYVSFVDHGNRAWVLLQYGAGVIAKIDRTPASPDCFNPVAAFGVIPLVDQGAPCVPAYGWYYDTVDHPFAGTPAQQFSCGIMYAQAAGW